eukprot:TRINITY_DN346_c0_g1_i1.p1 TRINITY_DN346_c0_g1~~TRINITY_DN346_c0_g1_i1.p1  ORF type:complete len:217 (-),score=37.91 TRINITY_DN346_c0_g1_i1:66-716(-)
MSGCLCDGCGMNFNAARGIVVLECCTHQLCERCFVGTPRCPFERAPPHWLETPRGYYPISEEGDQDSDSDDQQNQALQEHGGDDEKQFNEEAFVAIMDADTRTAMRACNSEECEMYIRRTTLDDSSPREFTFYLRQGRWALVLSNDNVIPFSSLHCSLTIGSAKPMSSHIGHNVEIALELHLQEPTEIKIVLECVHLMKSLVNIGSVKYGLILKQM